MMLIAIVIVIVIAIVIVVVVVVVIVIVIVTSVSLPLQEVRFVSCRIVTLSKCAGNLIFQCFSMFDRRVFVCLIVVFLYV